MVKCPYCKKDNAVEDVYEGEQEILCDKCGCLFDIEITIDIGVIRRAPDKRRPPPKPVPSLPPADSPCWFEALGHRWVTNSSVILRADAPLPSDVRFCKWLELRPDQVGQARLWLTSGVTDYDQHRRYGAYYAPILRALAPLGCHRFGRSGDPVLLAVVMPWRDNSKSGTVDERGNS